MLRKYKYYTMIFASGLIAFTSCSEQDEIGATLNVAPTVTAESPGNIKIGTADAMLTVAASDGETTPLASGTLTLLDANNNILAEVSQSLSGTADTVKMDNSISGLSARAEGMYKIVGSATDTGGLTTLSGDTATFELFDLPFDANYGSMYILGGFNGWGGSAEDRADFAFELTGPNTWTLENVALNGEWKFSVNPDFDATDALNEDWSDKDCDGTMESKSGGDQDGNTNCGFDGVFTITFNDDTFNYTLVNTNPPSGTISSLYLLGSFNGFFGDEDVAFRLDSSNYWVLDEVVLAPGDVFRFFEFADATGNAWGDNDDDGTAGVGEGNIMLPMAAAEGYYKVEFNDLSLEYELTYVRPVFPEQLFFVGSPVGWDAASAIQFAELSSGVYELYAYMEDGAEFKFLPQSGSFDGDYGDDPDNPGMIIQDGESNVIVAGTGFYRIIVDFNMSSFSLTETNWAVTGAGTPNGWPDDDAGNDPIGTDHDMTLVGTTIDSYTWTIDLDLTADGDNNVIKFRANDAWDLNLGDSGADGSLEYGGDNIVVPAAGNYTITLTLAPTGLTYDLTLN